jgi:hypothetical protein
MDSIACLPIVLEMISRKEFDMSGKYKITCPAFVFLLIMVSGCAAPMSEPGLPPAPTQTAISTTPTATAILSTSTPTATSLPSNTPTPEKILLTFTKNAFCRTGPGVEYFDKGSFDLGASAEAQGRNDAEPRWWYMLMENGDHCWVSDSTVGSNPQAESLPVQLPEKSLPLTPADVWADRVCKPGKGFAVTLNWTASHTADGYYVYLNGVLHQDVTRGTQTSYVLKLPLNEPASYAFEAYNSIGYGERITFDDPGCP